MNTVICDNSQQKKWDDFVRANSSDFGLLQSWAWGEFQQALGKKVFRLMLGEQDKIVAAAQIIKQPLPLGQSYFYLPRGPIVHRSDELFSMAYFNSVFSALEKLAKKEKAIFLRLDPAWSTDAFLPLLTPARNASHSDAGGKEGVGGRFQSVGQVQPKSTLILDLTKDEDELLSAMKPKTRYNIKVAEKHGIVIDEGEKYFDDFWHLTGATAQRQEIKPHAKIYYQKMLAILGAAGIMKLQVAKYHDQVIAANLLADCGQWRVYLHGASDYDYRDKMAPYLLQWQAIRQAKAAGKKFYDFWGVDEAKWPGVTRFKTGFAPHIPVTEYVGAYDAVYSGFWYNTYKLVKKIIHV